MGRIGGGGSTEVRWIGGGVLTMRLRYDRCAEDRSVCVCGEDGREDNGKRAGGWEGVKAPMGSSAAVRIANFVTKIYN